MALACCQRDLVCPHELGKVLVEVWEAEIGAQGHSRCTKWTWSPMGGLQSSGRPLGHYKRLISVEHRAAVGGCLKALQSPLVLHCKAPGGTWAAQKGTWSPLRCTRRHSGP